MNIHIAEFQPVSINEYPGEISSIIFTQGCNYACRYCFNPDLIPLLSHQDREYTKLLNEEHVISEVLKLKNKVSAVTITGGEPLIWHDLQFLMAELKSFGLLIKLNTNGSWFYRLKEIIAKGLVDYIDMDIKAPPKKYSKVIQKDNFDLDSVLRSVDLIKESGVSHIFSTVFDEEVLNESDISYIKKWVSPSKHVVREKI